MLRVIFIALCGFILGAVVIERKQHFSHTVAIPVAFLPDGGLYEGELLKGEPHQSGRIVWPNGHYYEGGFRSGLFHGVGRYHTDESTYFGEFANGVASGNGEIDYADGRQYSGGVEQGLPEDYGVMKLSDGEYSGEFHRGQFHGNGILQYANGDRYEGEFASDKFNGTGTYTTTDGKLFHGQFVDGAMNGQGNYRDDTTRYSGEFRNWLYHGQGDYQDDNRRYQGQFIDGLYEGVGSYSDSRRNENYQGAFVGGVYHGQGVLEFDGNRYEGGFEYGVQHGEGQLTLAQPLDGITNIKGRWRYGQLVESDNPLVEHNGAVITENVLYQQQQRLDQLLLTITEQDPERTELYFVGIAGDGTQGVFRREVQFIQAMFDRQYGTSGKSATLINSNFSWQQIPLATITSIETMLQGVAAKMDPEQDILFVYFTSHGSKDFNFQLQQPGLDLLSLSAEKMGDILKKLPVRHKVVVISACYAGGYVQPVKDDNTMIIVAAAKDKPSFGCSDAAEMTYFGEAFFKDALPQSDSFIAAFDRAREIVRGREAKEGFDYSDPLIFKPTAIVERLQQWRIELGAWRRDQNRLLDIGVIH